MVTVLLKAQCKEYVCKTLIEVVNKQYPLKSVKLHNVEYLNWSTCNITGMKVEPENTFEDDVATVIYQWALRFDNTTITLLETRFK